MHGNIPFGVATATEIARRKSRPPDKIVGQCKFYKVAKALWPEGTAPTIAAIANRDVRTAERWLSGEGDPSGLVIAAIIVEITKRD